MLLRLSFPGEIYAILVEHLGQAETEQAAFLFTSPPTVDDELRVVDLYLVPTDGFEVQSEYHIMLADDQRGVIISRAWEIGGAVVEAHSHAGTEPPSFSWSDMAGLSEWVPHVRWRLRRRPYVALVFNYGRFDALVWRDDQEPEPLDRIDVDGRATVFPTSLTYRDLDSRSI
jgi:hypothetical protein